MVIDLTCRVVAEQGLAVVAAEQEGEPVQILAQLADVVGGVADELFQGGAEAARIAGQPPAEELQQLGELGRVHDIEPEYRACVVTAFPGAGAPRRPCTGGSR